VELRQRKQAMARVKGQYERQQYRQSVRQTVLEEHYYLQQQAHETKQQKEQQQEKEQLLLLRIQQQQKEEEKEEVVDAVSSQVKQQPKPKPKPVPQQETKGPSTLGCHNLHVTSNYNPSSSHSCISTNNNDNNNDNETNNYHDFEDNNEQILAMVYHRSADWAKQKARRKALQLQHELDEKEQL
jgi:hypothetical protein